MSLKLAAFSSDPSSPLATCFASSLRLADIREERRFALFEDCGASGGTGSAPLVANPFGAPSAGDM